jgi:hypothetical protein
MSMYQQFQTDTQAERKGIVLDYGDFRVTIARAGGANKRFQKTLEARTRHLKRLIQTDNLDNEQAEPIVREVYADTVVLDWELQQPDGSWTQGIEGPEGEVLPVTKENILATFNNLPDLFADIKEQALKASLFRVALKEQAAKNSSSA